MKSLRKLLFWAAITFLSIAFITYAIAQFLPYEFADNRIHRNFYDMFIYFLPIAILITLLGTLRKENSNRKNWTLGILTVTVAGLFYVGRIVLLMYAGFGVWITEMVLYKHRFQNREIKEQYYDIGAFGFGGHRVVEIKPFIFFWVNPTPIDTMNINKEEWILVNKEEDLKFP